MQALALARAEQMKHFGPSTEADGLLDKAAQTTDDAEKMGYYAAHIRYLLMVPIPWTLHHLMFYAVSDKFI